MMDEFRIRISEMEHMQNKLNASVDVLDIRTKAGLGSQIPLLQGGGLQGGNAVMNQGIP